MRPGDRVLYRHPCGSYYEANLVERHGGVMFIRIDGHKDNTVVPAEHVSLLTGGGPCGVLG